MEPVRTFTMAEQFPDPSCPVAASVDPMHSGRVPMHDHEFSEIVCIVDGAGTYRLGASSLQAAAGDVFVIAPGEAHDLTAAGHMRLNNFMCDRAAVLDGAFTGLPAFAALFDLLPHLRDGSAERRHLRLDGAELTAVRDRHDTLVAEIRSQAVAWRQRSVALLQEVVALLCRSWSRQHPPAATAPVDRLARVIGHLHARLEEPLVLADLAAVGDCSEGHLRRLFHSHFGCSPKAYIQQRRLDRAAHLPRSGNDSITNIGLDCGFCDGNHFAKVFRRDRGMSPGEFRKRSEG
jgi:AraC-like DNA-binding protein